MFCNCCMVFIKLTRFFKCDLPFYHRNFTIMSNKTDATFGSGSAYPFGAPGTTPCICRGSCCSELSFLYWGLTVFPFFLMALSIYCRLMSMTIPLATHAYLFNVFVHIYEEFGVEDIFCSIELLKVQERTSEHIYHRITIVSNSYQRYQDYNPVRQTRVSST